MIILLVTPLFPPVQILQYLYLVQVQVSFSAGHLHITRYTCYIYINELKGETINQTFVQYSHNTCTIQYITPVFVDCSILKVFFNLCHYYLVWMRSEFISVIIPLNHKNIENNALVPHMPGNHIMLESENINSCCQGSRIFRPPQFKLLVFQESFFLLVVLHWKLSNKYTCVCVCRVV